MHKVITCLVIVLGIAVFISLALSFLAVFGALDNINFIKADHLSLLPGISIGCGGMIAILAFFRDRKNQRADQTRKSDEIYLSLARSSFDEVYHLLKDQNNDRVVWVRAARLLLQTLSLKEKIKVKDIIDGFQLAEERLRMELYRALSLPSDKYRYRQSLPPQFFYGIEDWSVENNLDNAAIKSGSKIQAHSVNIHENIPERGSRDLAVKSIVCIYDFLKFPENYSDPLPDVKIWEENWSDSHGIDQGARRFVSHKQENTVINGKLFNKKDNE